MDTAFLMYVTTATAMLLIIGIFVFSGLLHSACFYRLLYIERTYYRREWEKDGQPSGMHRMPEGYSLFRSRLAHDRLMHEWFYSTPSWIRTNKEARILIWGMRVTAILIPLTIFGPLVLLLLKDMFS